MFISFPYTPRKLEATESRLEAIMKAARLGLKGDRLAIAAGMMPTEYRQLCQFDPIVEYAELKARTESEMSMSKVLHDAALEGDIKAATTILQSQHDWKAAQTINVEIEQRISITQALELAQQRVATVIIDETPDRANDQGLLINNRKEDGDDYTDFKPSKAKSAV
jgi:hypothetical protein